MTETTMVTERGIHDIGPRQRRPQVAIVNGGGRDNVNAQFVLARLSAFLIDLDQGRAARGRLRERVLLAPCVEDDRREAVALQTSGAYYRIELCHAIPGMDALPQVRLQSPSDDERASACLFGLSAVIEHAHSDEPPLTGEFPHPSAPVAPADGDPGCAIDLPAWRHGGGECFLIVAGQGQALQTGLCEQLFQALVNFLQHVNVLEDIALAGEEADLHYFGSNDGFDFRADAAGLFVCRHSPGQWLQAGDRLGYLYDPLNGALIDELASPVSGLLTLIRRDPRVDHDTLLAVIHRRNRGSRQ